MRQRPYKRLTVPFTENGYRAIERLAAARNTSLGSAVQDWIEESHVMILKLAEATELAKTNPEQAFKLMQAIAEQAKTELTEEQLDLVNRS